MKLLDKNAGYYEGHYGGYHKVCSKEYYKSVAKGFQIFSLV